MTNPTLKERRNYDVEKLRKLNILMVEDNPLNTKLISILFSQNGLKLQVAKNGSEGVEKIKENDFDLVLMDMEMPVMNGYQATTMIRHELKNNIPIIAMTAHAMAGEREKCLQLGMNDYITKPVNADLLFATIYNLTCSSKNAEEKTSIAGSAEPASIPEKVCNLSYLVDATRGNKEIMNNIINVFLEQTAEELSALNDAIEKTNYKIIGDISHKIKSSFSILGISVLAPVFEEMERLGTIASGIEKIENSNRQVNTVFRQVREEIKQKN